ncbi:hypothetical protein ACL7TT_01345 [Microbulbifer sp. 2304DJ12-6]|uniref:hypothetical protein n=1 Tax=Microbulbifer sp. 2304DJ12-6 TaxID=3233340 RepID=UPI0039B0E7B0
MNCKSYLLPMLLGCFLTASQTYATDRTNAQLIKRIQYNGAAQTLFFVGESKWSSENCASATYIQIRSTEVPGIKEIMSIGLAAQMAGKDVEFWGACDSNPDYFNANYIVIE